MRFSSLADSGAMTSGLGMVTVRCWECSCHTVCMTQITTNTQISSRVFAEVLDITHL